MKYTINEAGHIIVKYPLEVAKILQEKGVIRLVIGQRIGRVRRFRAHNKSEATLLVEVEEKIAEPTMFASGWGVVDEPEFSLDVHDRFHPSALDSLPVSLAECIGRCLMRQNLQKTLRDDQRPTHDDRWHGGDHPLIVDLGQTFLHPGFQFLGTTSGVGGGQAFTSAKWAGIISEIAYPCARSSTPCVSHASCWM